MTNNYVSTVFGVLGVLAALTFPATPGNAAEAQTVLGGKLVVCGVCHGVNGLPKLEGVPIIWGLQENYILKQLHEFQHGDRASDTMKKIAINLTEEEVGPAAAYFATKQWPGPAKRLVLLAAPHNGDMRGLSSAKTGWRRSGAAARRPKVRLLGRVDAPLCGRPAKKQSRNEQHHGSDFGVRP